MSNLSFQTGLYWLEYLFGPFIIASLLMMALSGKRWLSKPQGYLIASGGAFAVAVVMGPLVDSPWLGTLLVSVALGMLFRYW